MAPRAGTIEAHEVSVSEPRRVSPVLMAGIIMLPAIFAWLLLRKGYGRNTRIAAFAYAAVMTSMGILGRID